jgi:flagellin-like protein
MQGCRHMQLNKHKKGISPVISWVLLLGFTISVGLMVYQYSVSQAETLTDTTVSSIETDAKCRDVNIKVMNPQSIDCSQISIINKGYFNIKKMNINEFDANNELLGTGTEERLLKPEENIIISVQAGTAIAEIIPFIEISEEKDVSCSDKALTVNC